MPKEAATSRLVHELIQPLTVIRLLAEALVQQPTDVARKATQISNQVDRIERIIRHVWRAAPVCQPTHINAVIHETIDLVTLANPLDGIAVCLDLAKDIEITIDKDQIVQVLTNLMRNALEAMQTDGGHQLLISSRKSETELEISVSDDGPGISPMVAARLFQPYVTSKPTGMGMGLAISRDIVLAHRGELAVRNAGGKGACFVIKLPL